MGERLSEEREYGRERERVIGWVKKKCACEEGGRGKRR